MPDGIAFWKMHGLGNDFMLIDGLKESVAVESIPVQAWADRHTGVGFDQLLLLLPSKKANVLCRIFNSDGSEAEQCGNGMRCVAQYWQTVHPSAEGSLTIETRGGIVKAKVRSDHRVEVSLGVPVLEPGWIELSVDLASKPISVFALSLGNPHAILRVDALQTVQVKELGQAIAQHPIFPKGVNVGFVEIVDTHTVALRTYERGTGETLACGSNTCAAAVTAFLEGWVHSPVKVQLPLGILEVWQSEDKEAHLLGEAKKIFEGRMVR